MPDALTASVAKERSFGKVMDQCCGDLKGALIEPKAFDSIKKHAEHFPLSLSRFWCFEIPLNQQEKTADFLFCISDADQFSAYFLDIWPAKLLNESPEVSFLPGILDFSVAWGETKTPLWKNVINIWFEYDYPGIDKASLKPNFFYAPAKGVHPFATICMSEKVLETISGKPVPKETLAHLLHCLKEVPFGGWVSQIGIMFARGEDTLRAFIQQIPVNDIKPYLDKIVYRYASDEQFNKLLEQCYLLADQVDLDIDISSVTGDSIGLECSFNEMQYSLDFLFYLFSNGLCIEEKYRALDALLRNLSIVAGKELQPFLSHFKIVYHPCKPLKTKVYIGYAGKTSASKIIRTKPFNH